MQLMHNMLQLVPGMYQDAHPDVSAAFQLFAAETVKSVLRIEKNQQLMCDVEFMSVILSTCRIALEDEEHLLHPPFQVGIKVTLRVSLDLCLVIYSHVLFFSISWSVWLHRSCTPMISESFSDLAILSPLSPMIR